MDCYESEEYLGHGVGEDSNPGMASYAELERDWISLMECCTTPDLQLAAQLGKDLLGRNKDLETTVKQLQTINEDQRQEIEYLTKQTAALREVNDSRLRIYEQLEVSILDLERTNQRQALDAATDKKTIKTLCVTIDTLEARCDDFEKQVEELKKQLEKKNGSVTTARTPNNTNAAKKDSFADAPCLEEEVDRLRGEAQELRAQKLRDQRRATKLEDQVQALIRENQVMEDQLASFQQKEEEMKTLQEEITTLEEIRNGQLCGRCSQKIDSRGPLYESLQLLDQANNGRTEEGDEEEVSLIDSFISDSHRASVLLQLQDRANENPYEDLAQKYEALMQIQSNAAGRRPSNSHTTPVSSGPPTPAQAAAQAPAQAPLPAPAPVLASGHCLSLQEELQMSGDFSSFRNEDDESGNEDIEHNMVARHPGSNTPSETAKKSGGRNKTFSMTPTDFSEAETSSSGFSDETSNKATQTGSALWRIQDGDDCRFTIYDDASPVDSHFRKTPEYRLLFREIFDVLKRAAEAKEFGEKLPLLVDLTGESPLGPPVTPAKEELPLLKMLAQDGTQTSVISEEASEICSEICSEIVADAEVQRVTERLQEEVSCTAAAVEVTGEVPAETVQNSSAASSNSGSAESKTASVESEPEPKPASPAPKRDIMEYLAMGVGPRKKSHSRKNSPHPSPRKAVERIDPANLSLVGLNTRVSYSKNGSPRRRRERHSDSPSRGSESPSRNSESLSRQSHSRSPSGHRSNANALSARCRKEIDENTSYQPSASNSQTSHVQGAWGSKPFASASQGIATLKKLEVTYADALRRRPETKVSKFTQVNYRMSYPK